MYYWHKPNEAQRRLRAKKDAFPQSLRQVANDGTWPLLLDEVIHRAFVGAAERCLRVCSAIFGWLTRQTVEDAATHSYDLTAFPSSFCAIRSHPITAISWISDQKLEEHKIFDLE